VRQRLRQGFHILILAAVTLFMGACGDPFSETAASFSYTSTPETGTPVTRSGADATWQVREGLGTDGLNHKSLFIALTTPDQAYLVIGGEDGSLTGSAPDTGTYPVGDGRNGTIVVTFLLSTDGSATSGTVRITDASKSTVVGTFDVWFGTPGLPGQSAVHLVGEFTAKHL
jgi:hypothetical protein